MPGVCHWVCHWFATALAEVCHWGQWRRWGYRPGVSPAGQPDPPPDKRPCPSFCPGLSTTGVDRKLGQGVSKGCRHPFARKSKLDLPPLPLCHGTTPPGGQTVSPTVEQVFLEPGKPESLRRFFRAVSCPFLPFPFLSLRFLAFPLRSLPSLPLRPAPVCGRVAKRVSGRADGRMWRKRKGQSSRPKLPCCTTPILLFRLPLGCPPKP